jgi:NAD(P)-dependent dehydrogenase (short-subunit alcohol dehydrogenase family)
MFSARPVRIDFGNLQGERSYGMWRAYSQSKLANLMTTYEIARRARSATANAIHPGLVRTQIARELPGFLTWPFHALFSKSPADAAGAIVRLATARDLAGTSGSYFDGIAEVRSSSASYDREVGRRLWAASCEMVGLEAGWPASGGV